MNAITPRLRRYSVKPASSPSTRISKRWRPGSSTTVISGAAVADIKGFSSSPSFVRWSRVCRLLVVAALTKLVDKPGTGRRPIEFGSGFSGVGSLIEEQDLGEGITQARPSLVVGAGHSARGADRDCSGLSYLGNGR